MYSLDHQGPVRGYFGRGGEEHPSRVANVYRCLSSCNMDSRCVKISPVPFLRTWIRFWRSRHVASSAAHRMARLNLSIPKGLNSVQQPSFDRRLMKPTARTECHSHCMVGCNPTFIMFSSRIPFKSLGRTARRTAGRN